MDWSHVDYHVFISFSLEVQLRYKQLQNLTRLLSSVVIQLDSVQLQNLSIIHNSIEKQLYKKQQSPPSSIQFVLFSLRECHHFI